MRKFLVVLALVATPAIAQDPPKTEQVDRVQAAVDAYLKASAEYGKFLATCKTCKPEPKRIIIPSIRIPKDDKYVPICAYGSC